MPVYITLTGLIALLFFLTGLFVYSRDPRRPLYLRCFIFSSAVALWALGYFITLFAVPSKEINLLASRFSHAFGAFIPITYLHFVWEILNEKPRKRFFVWAYLISGVMFAACLTPLVVRDLVPKMQIQYYPDWGTLYPVYSVFYFIFPGYAQYKMGRQILRTRGTERIRLIYFFCALGLAFAGGVSLFPLIFNIPIPPYSSVLIILYPPMMAYTILVHKFLDIQVIVRKTLVFAGLSTFVLCVFVLITYLVRNVLNAYASIGSTGTNLISIVVVILCYDRFREFLVNVTDRYLFQKKIDYRVLLKEASQQMASIKSLKRLGRLIIGFLIKKARISKAVLFVWSQEDGQFFLLAARPIVKDSEKIRLSNQDPLVQYLTVNQLPLEITAVEHAIKTSSDPGLRKTQEFIRNALNKFGAQAVIPSFLTIATETHQEESRLSSLLFLGPQKSDEPYSEEDLDVFFTLAQESSIAIENARLYDEAVQRTLTLAKMNRELGEMNEKLRATQASLIVAEKNATMVSMAKAIGHEINNPLSSVILPVEKIHRRQIPKFRDAFNKILEEMPAELKDKTKDQQKIIDTIISDIQTATMRADRSANRISAVVHTLTDILKDSKGEMSSLSFLVMCREAIEASRFSTSGLVGCEILQNIRSNLMIRGNLNQLLQVFVNLIKNAFEAMESQQLREIKISADFDPENPEMALIVVSDNGPGIHPDALPKIWMQGFSTKQKKDDSIGAAGQGQGLFVVKHMIESIHKGSISVESEPGRGTRFIVRLPLAEPQDA